METNHNAPLVNRVAQSGIITLNLEEFYPKQAIREFDLKDYLFHGLILKEKDFREAVKNHDWAQYQDCLLAVYCSSEAIIPLWAYQLVAIAAGPYAAKIVQGDVRTLLTLHYHEVLGRLDLGQFEDERVVVKGCGALPVPAAAYTEIARLLAPVAKSLMYGEPCSTVPLHKRKA